MVTVLILALRVLFAAMLSTCDQTASTNGIVGRGMAVWAQSPPSPEVDGTSTYYIAPSGSDSNAGTQSKPWKTIRGSVSKLQAGDTAILLDGTYEEGEVSWRNNGTPDKPITIRAANKWKAILSSTSGCNPAISVYGSYAVIQDLRIAVSLNNQGCSALSSANSAIRAWEMNTPISANPSTGSEGFTARGLFIDASSQRTVGIKTNQDKSLIENCEVHSSLEAFNNTDTVFRNNVIYGGDAWGDSIYGKGGVHNFQMYGNTLHMQNASGRGMFLGGNSGTQWVYDPTTGYEAYNSIARDNTIINETGNVNARTLGLVGTKDSTLQNNVGVNGGQIWLSPGGPWQSTRAPMPGGSTISGNTGMALP